jgi:hypothetical protein
MTAITTAIDRVRAVGLAFAIAEPVTDRTCDVGECPAPAQRTVEVFEQDFCFCMHHFTEQCLRLPEPPSRDDRPPEPGRGALAATLVPAQPCL